MNQGGPSSAKRELVEQLGITASALFPHREKITLREMAAALRCSAEHLAGLAKTGKLAATERSGRKVTARSGRANEWKVTAEEFDAFIARRFNLACAAAQGGMV